MGLENSSKLNQLLAKWPSQVVYTCSWLNDHGFGYDLINKYRKSGWLIGIGHGAVARAGDEVKWEGGVYAIQTQLKLPIHVGGKSALLLKGYGHFIPQGEGWLLSLFSSPDIKLPTWFKTYHWNAKPQLVTSKNFLQEPDVGLSNHQMGTFSIQVSSPERAIFEYLSQVPQSESFEEAKLLMEGLTTLRPKIVQRLLESSQSIKVKRLFLFLAEECNHSWVKKLEVSKINLGKGKRMIEKDGAFNSKYEITIPKSMSKTSQKSHL